MIVCPSCRARIARSKKLERELELERERERYIDSLPFSQDEKDEICWMSLSQLKAYVKKRGGSK